MGGKETTPKNIVFPEWTAEQLKLWLDKDEAACVSWREARAKKWEDGDEKLKATYPTREALDAWLDKQCKASKDKSLWKRTHAKKKPRGRRAHDEDDEAHAGRPEPPRARSRRAA